MQIIWIAIFAVGAFISGLNFYLSFIRYPLHHFRRGRDAKLQWVSGTPLVGSLFLWICALFTESTTLMWTALLLSLIDTGGLHWFVGTMIWMSRHEK